MTKGLEAFETILWCKDCDLSKVKEEIEIVKTALNEKVKLEIYTSTLEQVLQIIKEKMVDMWNLKYTSTYKEYNRQLGMSAAKLTQEEYDLLKEVLL